MTYGLIPDIFSLRDLYLVLATECRTILTLPEFTQCGRTLNP